MNVFNATEEDNSTNLPPPVRYYTPKEVADILRVPVSWVYERTRFGEIPMRKFGRLVRVPIDEFTEWEKEQTAKFRRA